MISGNLPCHLTVLIHELSLQIMDTLAEIQERHEAVRDVEKKLLDLQQVFNQFVQLI